MADIIDRANDYHESWLEEQIRKHGSATIPKGEPGECEWCTPFDSDFCELRLLEAVHVDERFALATTTDRNLDTSGFELLCDRNAPGGVASPITPVDDSHFVSHMALSVLTSCTIINRP